MYAAGELEAETLALLEMEAVSHVDFASEVLACLPQVSDDNPWSISHEERALRRDFTGVRYMLSAVCLFYAAPFNLTCLVCCSGVNCEFVPAPS